LKIVLNPFIRQPHSSQAAANKQKTHGNSTRGFGTSIQRGVWEIVGESGAGEKRAGDSGRALAVIFLIFPLFVLYLPYDLFCHI